MRKALIAVLLLFLLVPALARSAAWQFSRRWRVGEQDGFSAHDRAQHRRGKREVDRLIDHADRKIPANPPS
jgi:hypothetical protein